MCIYIDKCVYIYAYIYTHMYIHIYVCIHVYVIHMCIIAYTVRMIIYICIHTIQGIDFTNVHPHLLRCC